MNKDVNVRKGRPNHACTAQVELRGIELNLIAIERAHARDAEDAYVRRDGCILL